MADIITHAHAACACMVLSSSVCAAQILAERTGVSGIFAFIFFEHGANRPGASTSNLDPCFWNPAAVRPQPVGQRKHTNIIIVSLHRGKKRFEIACYPNKVLEWRSGTEKDIDKVLQTDRIFMSVSLGEFAKKNDLKEAFNNTNEPEICLQILKLGEMQISEKERGKQNEALFHEIASVVVEKCVDSNTKLPLTVAMIERAIKGLKHRFDMNKSAKQQALKIIPLLADQFPIERAKMLIRVVVAPDHAEAVKPQLLALMAKVMNEIQKGPYVLVGIIEPARYRDVDQIIKTVGTLEVLNPRVTGAV